MPPVELAVGAKHEDVRLDTDAPQLLDGVLGGLGLELADRVQERHERDVDEHDAFSRPISLRIWRIASRNGWDSMSPTVPPTSTITTSAAEAAAAWRMRSLIALVMCGMTCTVAPR